VITLSCGQRDELLAPLTGALSIQVVTNGTAPDADGYTVTIDGQDTLDVTTSDTIVRGGLTPGSHAVALSGIPEHCTLAGANPRASRVTAEDTSSVEFRLACSTTPSLGALRATVRTLGSPPDSDGYQLAVDPTTPSPLGLNDTTEVADLAPGRHLVRLQGVADYCFVAGENPRAIEVPAGDTATTGFEVTCRPPLSGRIAFAGFRADGSFNSDLFLIRPDGTGLIDLTPFIPDVQVSHPSFSLDGKHLAASFSGEIALVGPEIDPVSGSPSIQPVAEGFCPALSSDGSRLAYQVDDGPIYVQDTDGGDPELLLAESPDEAFRCPAWSPDDSRLAVPVAVFTTDSSAIYLVPVNGGPREVLNVGPLDAFVKGVSWSPRGDRLAFAMSVVLPEEDDVEVHDVFIMDLAGHLTNLTAHRVFFASEPRWSPDGTRLVLAGSDGLYVINDDGTGLTRVTQDEQRIDREPTWAPE
jgi:hypothetical protein